jgi:hypothetical protein
MDGGIKLPRSPLMGRCLCFLRGGFVGRGGYNGGGSGSFVACSLARFSFGCSGLKIAVSEVEFFLPSSISLVD